jgi:hypothetical protein
MSDEAIFEVLKEIRDAHRQLVEAYKETSVNQQALIAVQKLAMQRARIVQIVFVIFVVAMLFFLFSGHHG